MVIHDAVRGRQRGVWRLLTCFLICVVCCSSGADLRIPSEAVHVLRVEDSADPASRQKIIQEGLPNREAVRGNTVWLPLEEQQAVVLLDAKALRAAQPEAIFLTLGWPHIWQWFQVEEVSLYRVDREGQLSPVTVDEKCRFCYVLPEISDRDEYLAVWVEKAHGVVCLPGITVLSEEEVLQEERMRLLMSGILYGVFMGLIVSAAFGFFMLRDVTFLWYITQLVLSMLIMLVDSPLQCLPVSIQDHLAGFKYLPFVLLYANAMVFTQRYLDTKSCFPRIHRILSMLAVLYLSYIVGYMFMPGRLKIDILYVIDLTALFSIWVSFYAWKKGHILGKYFAISAMPYIFVYICLILVELLNIPPLMPINDMLAFAGIFEGVLLPLGLIVRVRMIVAEKQRIADANAHLQAEEMRARMLAREAELRMLRFQINPHFLFNALNSLIAEIPDDPKLSLRIAMKLSAYLRYTLTSRDKVLLSEEIAALRQYLELEEIRFEEQLQLAFVLPEVLPRMQVPMFCIQPLVENAVKYGMQTSPTPLQLKVTVESVADGAVIEVANTGEWREKGQESTGVGLKNVRDRLRIYYPETHEFSVNAEGGWVRVRLMIPDA